VKPNYNLVWTAVQGDFIETRMSIDSFLPSVIPSFPALFKLEFEIRIWTAGPFIKKTEGGKVKRIGGTILKIVPPSRQSLQSWRLKLKPKPQSGETSQ
jgi:hypothetical protein